MNKLKEQSDGKKHMNSLRVGEITVDGRRSSGHHRHENHGSNDNHHHNNNNNLNSADSDVDERHRGRRSRQRSRSRSHSPSHRNKRATENGVRQFSIKNVQLLNKLWHTIIFNYISFQL